MIPIPVYLRQILPLAPVVIVLCASLAQPGGASSSTSPAERPQAGLSGSLYIRTETDQTTVVSPAVHFRTADRSGKVELDITYAADVWTSASVDVRTAATGKVDEQRDEIDVGLAALQGTSTIGLAYRYSHEVDYRSHSVGLSAEYEAFQRTTTFAARLSVAADWIGRSGDTFFSEHLNTTGVWVGVTQILGPTTLAQASYEHRYSRGYMASPYRYVPIGSDTTCGLQAVFCVPEVHPNIKERRAAVVRLRQALGARAIASFLQ